MVLSVKKKVGKKETGEHALRKHRSGFTANSSSWNYIGCDPIFNSHITVEAYKKSIKTLRPEHCLRIEVMAERY